MITQEDFDKLKQNDRIEYLLRKDYEFKKEDNLKFNWLRTFYAIIMIACFCVLVFLGLSNLIGMGRSIGILRLIVPLLYIGMFIAVFGIIYNLVITLMFNKRNKELESYFFKKEVKPKR